MRRSATIARARASRRGSRRRPAAKASSSRGRRRAASTKPRGFAMKRSRGGDWRPKRALAPYMFFCKAQRENITSDNPNISFGDVGRILGSQWQSMSEKDKKVLTQNPHKCVPIMPFVFLPLSPAEIINSSLRLRYIYKHCDSS